MRYLTLVTKELTQRKARFLTCLLAIALAVALMVGVDSLSRSAERAVERHLENLGANMLVVPNELSLFDFFRGEFGTALMSEKNVDVIHRAAIPSIHKLAPRLSRKLQVNGEAVMITGVVPEWELLYGKALGVLDSGTVVLGSAAAAQLAIAPGATLTLRNRAFRVAAALEETGGPDDLRVFLTLPAAQEVLNTGRAINEIGLVVDTSDSGDGVAQRLGHMLHDARVIKVEAIAEAQAAAIETLRTYAFALLGVILLASGAAIANYMVINVRERRREIGTFLALGATPNTILWLFVAKALILGLTGGLVGYLMGAAFATTIGPMIVNTRVSPSATSLLWSVLVAVALAVVFSVLPARRAARTDPAQVMQET